MKRLIVFFLTTFILLSSLPANGQWRIGATAGLDYNFYSRSNYYWENMQYCGLLGGTMGIVVQYSFTDRIGMRLDFNWTQKNNLQKHKSGRLCIYQFNEYLQLPIMGTLTLGNSKLKATANFGVYGAYCVYSWQYCRYWSHDSVQKGYSKFSTNRLNKERDQRIDYGFVGGMGIEYKLTQRLSAQLEARCYYSTESTTKDYMAFKDYRYNTTLVIQPTILYHF